MVVKAVRGIMRKRIFAIVKNCLRLGVPGVASVLQLLNVICRVPKIYGSGCKMLFSEPPINPVILRSGSGGCRDTDTRLSGSEAATAAGRLLFIGGAPMKGRAGALPLAYLEQSAEMRKMGNFTNEL